MAPTCDENLAVSAVESSEQTTVDNCEYVEVAWDHPTAVQIPAGTPEYPPSPSDLFWSGQVMNWTSSQAECPTTFFRSVRAYHGATGQWFKFPGPLYYYAPALPTAILRQWPHAEYVTDGEVVSLDGTTRLMSARVRGACAGNYVVNAFGVRIWLGSFFAVGAIGIPSPRNGGSPGGYQNGWGSDNSGAQSGAGDGWQIALTQYLSNGGCSVGWEIWVDGQQKCAGDQ